MKCKIDSSLICYEQVKTGSGAWDYFKSCQSCEIFLKNRQTILGMEKMSKKEKTEWFETELEQANEKRKEALEAKGYKELFAIPEGETTFTIDTSIAPRTAATANGDRKVIRVKVGKTDKDIMLNPNIKFWTSLLVELNNGKTHFTVIRVGQKKDTRYSIKKAW